MPVHRPTQRNRRPFTEPGGLDGAEFLHHEVRRLRHEFISYLMRTHAGLGLDALVSTTQNLVDHTLLVLFAEARGLLPAGSFERACSAEDGPNAAFGSLLTLFDALLRMGAPIAIDPRLFELQVENGACQWLSRLASFDYRKEISVEALGHLFEQSNADLEDLQARLLGPETAPKKRRRRESGFYCPPRLTGFLVRESLGRTFLEMWADTASIDNQAKRLRAYLEKLSGLRVLDPACGTGAFLMGALETLAREQKRIRLTLFSLNEPEPEPSDPTANLFGFDTNQETVMLCRLSLWLKMAERRMLPSHLERHIQRGNALISDAEIDPHAVPWADDPLRLQSFDVVLCNPPIARHELGQAQKNHFREQFRSYDAAAEPYIYQMERGLMSLKPGGRMAYMVPSKWFRAGYAEPLRAMLGSDTTLETLVDFGSAPILPETDVFPSMLILRKQRPAPDHPIRISVVPREQTGRESIAQYVENQGFALPQARLHAPGWLLDRPEVLSLMEKVHMSSMPMGRFLQQKPTQGVKVAHSDAFIVDGATRERLIAEDPSSAGLFKKYLRGHDIARWSPSWGGHWIIMLDSSDNHMWPWTEVRHDRAAEFVFAKTYPSIHAHLKMKEKELRERPEPVRYYWELPPGFPTELLEQPKILWKDVTFLPDFAVDRSGFYVNESTYFLPTADPWILGCLNSPVIWSWLWRHTQHGRDDALKLKSIAMDGIPIARPLDDMMRSQVAHMVARLSDPASRPERSDLIMLERRTAELIHQAYGLTAEDEALLWETAPPRTPLLDWSGPPGRSSYG